MRRLLHELPAGLFSQLLSPVPVSPPVDLYALYEHDWPTIDWPSLAADANRHGVGVIVFQRLREGGAAARLPAEVAAAWEADAFHARMQCNLQRADALQVASHLRSRSIPHAFLKGLPYRETLYRPVWIRLSGDTDLLVHKRDVERARAALREIGFFQASCADDYTDFRPATPWQIRETEANHHELAQFVKIHRLVNLPDGFWGPAFVRKAPFSFERGAAGPLFNSALDVHWAAHFLFADEPVLETAVEIEVTGKQRIPAVNLVWSVVITLFKLYFESFDRVHRGFGPLADLAALLREPPPAGTWERIGEIVSRHGIEAATFYTLSAAEDVAGRRLIPAELLASWSSLSNEQATRKPVLDFGDFISYVTGRRARRPLPFASQTPEPAGVASTAGGAAYG
jgi:hypothetical protein